MQKCRINIKKHGIDFNDVSDMFSYPMITALDSRHNEERWFGLGLLKGTVSVVVYTEDDELEIIRIISVRKAEKYEEKRFKETFRD